MVDHDHNDSAHRAECLKCRRKKWRETHRSYGLGTSTTPIPPKQDDDDE